MNNMSTNDRFTTFTKNISTTKDDRDDAQTKYDGVARKLHSHYYGTTFDGSTRRLIGSYAKGTAVRPRRDVDLLFLMPYSYYERYNSYAGNGQSRLLQDVKTVLQERYPTTEKIRGDGHVVVVEFSGGHTVELLPAWLTTTNRYLIPDTHGGGSWKTADHTAEIDNVGKSNTRSNGNTCHLIKMMKTWQAECNVPIKSMALELRSVNFLASWAHYDRSFTYYDWMVRDFFQELVAKAGSRCKVPGIDEYCDYGSEWLSRAQTAHARAVKACEFESANEDYEAAVEWRKIFGGKYAF
jgi:SMODS domain-containing protein